MFWTITGWIIALLALIVNYLQLKENKKLRDKYELNSIKNKGIMENSIQQSHSGKGDNIVQGSRK
ncbi:hypothetical protein LPY66_02765 [Dehalobacter sp. DCM]|uniref:hypothetical protein n=1 Tax=Dehalobacter sp. DCM TaxID=2907827 RepID=UPI0030812F0E|nr:hypothetical protein LPY66_02765 [Dehalobacter sp. DCM]